MTAKSASPAPDGRALDGALVERVAAARERWGELGVSEETLVTGLRERLSGRASASGAGDFEALLERTCATDLVLAVAWQAGSEPAWRVFGAEFREDLLRVAARQGADPERALALVDGLPGELLASDSLLDGYHGRGSLASWLAVVVRRRVIDEVRRRTRAAGEIPPEVEGDSPDPTRQAVSSETHRRLAESVADLIEELTPRERCVLLLKYSDGLAQRSIARSLGISDGRVTRLVQNAFAKLARRLRAGFPDGEPDDFPGMGAVWLELERSDSGVKRRGTGATSP